MSTKTVIYTTTNCAKCKVVKAQWDKEGKAYEEVLLVDEVDLFAHEGMRQVTRKEFYAAFPGVRGVPHIVEVPQ